MMFKSGILVLKKTEQKEFQALINHVERDLGYGVDGSFGDGAKLDEKDVKKVTEAVDMLKRILNFYCD